MMRSWQQQMQVSIFLYYILYFVINNINHWLIYGLRDISQRISAQAYSKSSSFLCSWLSLCTIHYYCFIKSSKADVFHCKTYTLLPVFPWVSHWIYKLIRCFPHLSRDNPSISTIHLCFTCQIHRGRILNSW